MASSVSNGQVVSGSPTLSLMHSKGGSLLTRARDSGYSRMLEITREMPASDSFRIPLGVSKTVPPLQLYPAC